MYLHNIPAIQYTDPWLHSFNHRLALLKNGQKRIAYYYDKPDSSTFRYRVYNMIQSLSESSLQVAASYFWGDELKFMDKILLNTDVIVICRSRYTEQLGRFISIARSKGKKVFFDIDDLVFNPIFSHLVIDSLNEDINNPIVADFWFSLMGKQAATLNLCDEAIATNDYLANLINKYSGKKTSVIPNFLNNEQIETSTRIFDAKSANQFKRDAKFHLGYFSGSPTHAKDFAVALDAFILLMEKYQNIHLRIVGFMDVVKPLQKFASRIERYPLQDFLNLQRLIGDVELNIVPLQNNDFTNCKSELKYFEAGIAGTLTLASPTFTYTNAIVDGKNGFLAKSYEWYDKISLLASEPDSLISVASAAYHASLEKYAPKKQTDKIASILVS
jgi:glycosyltransferase involved in cell wall biosynthesis